MQSAASLSCIVGFGAAMCRVSFYRNGMANTAFFPVTTPFFFSHICH